METLLVGSYVAICVAIFKIFKIPLNKWTIPTAFLGGVVLIGAILTTMNYSHPYSAEGREYFYSTPISPTVKGRVVAVEVKANTPLKAGDVLFRLDPEPYQDKVDELSARLKAARKNLSRAKQMMKKGLGKQLSVDETQSSVDSLSASLQKAKFDLDETVVYAPTDGFVTQLFLHPGMLAVPMPLRPLVVFVHADSFEYVAWFRQNNLSNLKAGYEAEIAFDGIPGKVFKGEVETVLSVLAQGELQASGHLTTEKGHEQGLIPVKIKITDPEFNAYRDMMPGGAYAQTAIYSEHFEELALIRRVLLRMSSWMNFVFPMH